MTTDLLHGLREGKKGQRVHRGRSHTYESICAQLNTFGTSVGINVLINPTCVSDRKGSVTSLAKPDDEKLVQRAVFLIIYSCFRFKRQGSCLQLVFVSV